MILELCQAIQYKRIERVLHWYVLGQDYFNIQSVGEKVCFKMNCSSGVASGIAESVSMSSRCERGKEVERVWGGKKCTGMNGQEGLQGDEGKNMNRVRLGWIDREEIFVRTRENVWGLYNEVRLKRILRKVYSSLKQIN